MKEKIITPLNAIYIGDFKILIQFDNGELKIADFNKYLVKDLKSFSEIKNEEYFKNFELDIFGGICWPNGYDIAPDYLYETSKPASISIAG